MKSTEFVFYTVILILGLNIFGLLVTLLTVNSKYLHKYRIQDKPLDPKGFYQRLPLIGFNVLTLAGLSSICLFGLFGFFDSSLSFNATTIFWQVAIMFLIDDLWFYCLHRWMHSNKKVLKKVHSIHHRSHSPVALDYIYTHPIEWLSGSLGLFLGLLVVAFIQPPSIWAFWIYQIIRNLHELDVHSGFKSILSPWIPFWGEGEHHDLHHKKLRGNYATTFTHWDRIFGTKM